MARDGPDAFAPSYWQRAARPEAADPRTNARPRRCSARKLCIWRLDDFRSGTFLTAKAPAPRSPWPFAQARGSLPGLPRQEARITHQPLTIRAEPVPVPTQPRAIGALRLSARRRPEGTRLMGLRQSGALRALFPRRGGAALEAIVVNTAGGVTGGDRLAVEAAAEDGAHLTLTTQAAERAYRAQPGSTGIVRNTLRLGGRARLAWLPQETILYDGCAMSRTLGVEMARDAAFTMVEALVFGRAAMGETLRGAWFRDRVD